MAAPGPGMPGESGRRAGGAAGVRAVLACFGAGFGVLRGRRKEKLTLPSHSHARPG